MNVNFKRFLSLLLVCLLMLGLPFNAMAASSDTTEPTEPTIPAETQPQETESTESVTIDPTEGTEPPATEETDTSTTEESQEAATEQTDVGEETELVLPEEALSPGVQVDNEYPADLLEPDPYAISLLADMTAIPDEMYDNAILRAMQYAGYDIQWLKDNGYLYVAQYVSSNINSSNPAVLSNIGYDDYSPYLNGDETVTDSSTVSGKAPDIASFEANGLVCASYVSYFINNYLPNIEGVDTSHIANAIKATTMNNGSYSTASVWAWETGLSNLASQANSGVTRYTDATTAYANLVPGDVIIFSRDGSLIHAAIYMGTYDFYNASGTNRGQYHFISHVGNSRGPEISTVEYMVSAGSKGSTPSAWYHLDINDTPKTGYIEINKTNGSGAALAGATFIARDQSTGLEYTIGPTNSAGYARAEVPLSTFTVYESVFPSGYQASGQSEWTVTLSETTANLTITINAVNDPITGALTIQKASNTGAGLAGWKFGVYTDSACTKPISGSPFTSGPDGAVTISNLTPATYYVKELSESTDYWVCDNGVKTVTVQGNKTTSVTITNTHYGYGKIVKKTNTGTSLSGWKFNIYTDANRTQLVSGSPFTTDANGEISVKLLPGDYWCVEVDESSQFPDWEYDTTVRKLTVAAGKTVSVTFTNSHYGYVKIVKETNTGASLSGWKFNIYTDAACTQLLEGSPFVSGADGTITTRILPGNYFIVEVDESAKYPDWVFDTSIHIVTVKAGETASVTIHNSQQGKIKLMKSMPEGGSVAGWTFEVYRVSDDAHIGSFTSGEDGTILVDQLLPGEYRITENIPEDSIYYCETSNPQTVTVTAGQTAEVTFTNRIKPAEIVIQKVDTAGNPLAGAVFLLEWSVDGVDWLPVTSTDSPYVTEGTCSSEGLKDGSLTSPEDGWVRYSGLHPERHYRLTEVSAPEGYQLLAGTAFEGTIPADKSLTVTLTVVNALIYELPMTGSKSFTVMAISLFVCIAGCIGALVYLRRKEQ